MDYPAWPEDERTDRARAVEAPHRYRGGRLMLVRPPSPFGVVRLTGYWFAETGPVEYKAETLAGAAIKVAEHDLVEPDAAATLDALTSVGPTLSLADLERLSRAYVWVGMHGAGADDPDWALTAGVRDPAALWGRAPEPDDAYTVWSTRERALAVSPAPDYWVGRLPFVAACRLADGRLVVADHGEPWQLVLGPEGVVAMSSRADGVRAPSG